MSSGLQSALEVLQANNYVALAGIIAVVYDYFLVFPREVEYVWRKPWTWISTVFLLVRYVGLCSTITDALAGTTLIPGPQIIYSEGTATFVVAAWGLQILLLAADLIMMLRVYAMWNRSKPILYGLLCIYVPEVVLNLVFTGIYNDPNTHLAVSVVQVVNFTFCTISYQHDPSYRSFHVQLPRFAFSTLVFLLAVFQTLKQSVTMYKATKQWQPNRYVQLFVREGILYFLMDMFFNMVTLLQSGGNFTSIPVMILFACGYVAICIAIPRFILGMRELYDRDIRGRFQGIDTGFGVVSQPFTSQRSPISAMEFADAPVGAEDQATEEDGLELENIQLERWHCSVNHP